MGCALVTTKLHDKEYVDIIMWIASVSRSRVGDANELLLQLELWWRDDRKWLKSNPLGSCEMLGGSLSLECTALEDADRMSNKNRDELEINNMYQLKKVLSPIKA